MTSLDALRDVAARAAYRDECAAMHTHPMDDCRRDCGCNDCAPGWGECTVRLSVPERQAFVDRVRPVVEALAPLIEAAERRAEQAEAACKRLDVALAEARDEPDAWGETRKGTLEQRAEQAEARMARFWEGLSLICWNDLNDAFADPDAEPHAGRPAEEKEKP